MERSKLLSRSVILFMLLSLWFPQNLYSDEGCNLHGFKTYTQGGWGSPSNSTPGGIRDDHFSSIFPTGATLGGGFTAKFTTASAVNIYLPAGGQSQAYTQNYNNASSTSAGVFGGQVLALYLNVKYDSAGHLGTNSAKLGNLVVTSGTFSGKTVNQILYWCNVAIGGGSTPYTISQLNVIATSINENFDNGTVDNGNLTCAPTQVLPASVGDKVWIDANHNGTQDADETGLANVTVKLYNCSDALISSTTTNASGVYSFTNLTPGSYYVQFTAPADYSFTTKNAGADPSKDSDADATTGKTACFTLTSGLNDLTRDCGLFVTPASLGDKVWNDVNKNGIQDEDESGIANVTVKLFDCSNNLISTTITDATGNYGFTNLTPSSYYVQFIAPAGYTITIKNAGSNTSKDSDADVLTGKTVCKAIASHVNDLTIDAGMFVTPVINTTDLQVTKTVNSQTLTCGQSLVYTIKVKNNGPISAGNIVVVDSLPTGLDYTSSNVTQGTFVASTGKWTVGTLSNGATATLNINATVNCVTMNSSTIDLGPAKSFNLFVLENLNQPSSDTQGKLAVGGNATLDQYSVGDQLPNSNGTVDVLVVGKTLLYYGGRVYSGNVVYGDSTNLPIINVGIDGTLRKDSVINFPAAKVYLESLSAQLGEYSVNGTAVLEWSTLILAHSDPFLNVFKINASDLNAATTVQINVPNGAAVVVNIMGNNIYWHGGLFVTGTVVNNVIYNFPEATVLKIGNIDIKGSVLAPFAALDFPSGLITGQVVVKSMVGSGQFNLSPFLGNIPLNRSVSNMASILSSDVTDSDVSNNHSSVSGSFAPSSSGTGNTSGWQLAGNLPAGQTITCLENDNAGNTYAGSSAGIIFKTTNAGQSWTHANPDMSPGAIWQMKAHSNGNFFVASENGVYVSTDNCVTWSQTTLQNKDTRTLKVDAQGNIYAGTWRSGIYKSTDGGTSWNEANSGLGSHLIVTSVEFAANQNVFAGTFDGGVFKSADNGSTWIPANIGYNSIWALATNSNGILFAGTYGDGLYRSTNNGVNWTKTSFPAVCAYDIKVDGQNNLYASAYASGVFASTNNGDTWTYIGMGGMSLSSILIAPTGSTPSKGLFSGNTLFTGTSTGKIYKKADPTAIGPNEKMTPAEYSMQQNYPNPFNPSTTIRYEIPYESKIIIKVYDVTGRLVATLFDGIRFAGLYETSFNASKLASGLYIYSMNAISTDGNHNFTVSKKMLLIK